MTVILHPNTGWKFCSLGSCVREIGLLRLNIPMGRGVMR
ncbi:hypothetical protein LINPERHAP2_LOCUS14195 [Linum perenne]